MKQSLVLNVACFPVGIVSWQSAITRICKGSAQAIEEYDEVVRSPRTSMYIPSIIMMNAYYVPDLTNVVPFNRENIYRRDNGTCMYCGKKVSLSTFTFEHIIPQSRGGKTEWMNIVVACLRCNARKGSRTPKEAHMKLIRPPYVPKLSKAAPRSLVNQLGFTKPDMWSDYIYWNVILEE